MPFNHVSIANSGNYQICCMHQVPAEHKQNINHTTVDEWLQNPYLMEVRSAFAQDQKHPGCQRCWQQEESGTQSTRQVQEKEYRIIGAVPMQTKLLNVEFAVGNLCNLACVMCDEYNSSLILSENKQLGIAIADQRDFSWTETAFENLQKILDYSPKIINLRGGEPLYNKRILELIENFPTDRLNSTLLHLTTNATTWTPRWQQALSKFKAVRMMLSVDAVGDLAGYIRYPTKFAEVEKNIQQIVECKNIKPIIHTTVQNLNVMHLGSVIRWAQNINIHLMLDLLVRPDHLEITNLPTELKQQAIEHLDLVLLQKPAPHIQREVTAYKTSLEAAMQKPFEQQRWNKFKQVIGQRDQLRGNSHKDFLNYID